MKYQFTKDLETGNTTIDSEHKELINAVNKVMADVSQGKGKDSLKQAVTFLNDYTKKHFRNEEQLQLKSSYPDMPNHKVWHKNFIDKLQSISDKLLQEGASSPLVLQLTNTVSQLITHIKTEDKKLANFLKTS